MISLLLSFPFLYIDWPVVEMAQNLSVSNPLTTMEYLKELSNCIESAKEHMKMMAKKGKMTAFTRSTKESEELGMNRMISKTMKMALNDMSGSSQRSKRQTNTVDQIIDENCVRLTEKLKSSMVCPDHVGCDPVTEFSQISGCCNNLRQKSRGNTTQHH